MKIASLSLYGLPDLADLGPADRPGLVAKMTTQVRKDIRNVFVFQDGAEGGHGVRITVSINFHAVIVILPSGS